MIRILERRGLALNPADWIMGMNLCAGSAGGRGVPG